LQLKYFDLMQSDKKISALLEDDDVNLYQYYDDGVYNRAFSEAHMDLLMATKTKKLWIGLSNIKTGDCRFTTHAYEDEKSAKKAYGTYPHYQLIQIEIEIEE
jgi:hypothetical protein